MDYITTKEAAKDWKVADRMVVYDCSAGRIKEAKKMGNTWRITVDAEKQADERHRSSKVRDGENK